MICAATLATIPTAVIFVLVTTASIHRYSSELDAVIIEPRNGMRPHGEVGRTLKHRAISCRGIIRRITRHAWCTHISILTRILGTLVDQIPGGGSNSKTARVSSRTGNTVNCISISARYR